MTGPAGGVVAFPLGGVVTVAGGGILLGPSAVPDAPADQPSLALPTAAAVEEGQPITVAVTRTGTGACSAWLATEDATALAGTHYAALPPTLVTFAADEASKTVTVQTNFVADELEPALPSVAVPASAAVEEGQAVTLTVTRTGTGACSVTVRSVDDTALAGTHYTALPPTVVTFGAGEASKTVTVQTAAQGGAPALPSVALPASAAAEEGQQAWVTITRTGTGACSVTVRSQDDTALAGTHYAALPPTVVSFAADEASRTVAVQTTAPGTAPAPLPVLSLPAALVAAEGSTLAVTISRTGSTAGSCLATVRSVDVTAVAGADHAGIAPHTVVFAPGETSRAVTVAITADGLAEGDETFRVELLNPSGCTLGNAACVVTIPGQSGGTPDALFTTTLENADTVASWADQELAVGQWFAKGDVPAGSVARATVDGAVLPLQLSSRVHWNDGSLKWAHARMLVPSVPAGGTKQIAWQRVAGTWAAHDAPLHADPAAVTAKAALLYRFTSFRGRDAAGVLTAELGPKSFHSGDMLSPSNAPWIERVAAGPVCTEWRASDMAKLPAGTRDPHLGCLLYARAWGGTPGNPRRIQFLFRSMYGWNDPVPTDQRGLRCSVDLLVNNAVARGAALATPTPGWKDRDSYVGGFYASPGPSGEMDWYDVATARMVTPPRLLYRINVAYGVRARFLPPYDTDNATYAAPTSVANYEPQGRGGLNPLQANVGDWDFITWGTSKPFVRAMVAHARRPADEAVTQARDVRVSAWGMAALGAIGFNRATRRILCLLPTERNPDPTALGASVYDGTRPHMAPSDLNPYISGQDAPHFPQVTWWTLITEGDQHFLDLAYHEATLPGTFCQPAEGRYNAGMNQGYNKPAIRVGGIYCQGQTRGVGHAARPILNVMAVGQPTDPHHKLAKALWAMFLDAREARISDSDWWRNTAQPDDGRYFAKLKMYPFDSTQEPGYKVWMHTFSLFSTSYGYGVGEDPDALRLAQWWAHTPTVLCGGYHDDPDSTHYLWKPDPVLAQFYYILLASAGTGATNNDRRPFAFHGQWGVPVACTYKADNQTVDLGQACANGMVMTVTGVHQSAEPGRVTDMTKIPGGLVRGAVYYSVQASGNTCKLSTTRGGAPVTFASGGADIAGNIYRAYVFGQPGHVMRPSSQVSQGTTAYHNQLMAALDFYQHYVAPADARVLLARTKMKAIRDERGGDFDLRAKTTVPYSLSSNFTSEFTSEFA